MVIAAYSVRTNKLTATFKQLFHGLTLKWKEGIMRTPTELAHNHLAERNLS